jgi:hypothetical protein
VKKATATKKSTKAHLKIKGVAVETGRHSLMQYVFISMPWHRLKNRKKTVI